MSANLNKLIQSAKQVNLSREKKDLVRARLESFIELTPITKISPQPVKPHFMSRVSISYFGKAISFALIVLIAGGSTISYASEDTLPGDTLYTVKVNVKEPLEEKFAITPQAKLEIKTKQVEKRLTEAQTLIQKNDLTPEKHKEVERQVEKKVGEITKKIDELQEVGDIDTILATTSKLQPVLKAHKEALEKEKIQSESIAAEKNSKTINETPLGSEPISISIEQSILFSNETSTSEQTNSSDLNIIQPTKTSTITENLLKTVEKTLITVEEKETRAIETISESHNGQEVISGVTNKKVEYAEKQIEQIKTETKPQQQSIPAQENIIPVENVNTLQEINKNSIQDIVTVTLADAEILLTESKELFEKGLYKESLVKAQEAVKITSMIEANKKIEIKKEETFRKTSSSIKQLEEIKTPLEEHDLKIEDQASQAIQALEKSLLGKE